MTSGARQNYTPSSRTLCSALLTIHCPLFTPIVDYPKSCEYLPYIVKTQSPEVQKMHAISRRKFFGFGLAAAAAAGVAPLGLTPPAHAAPTEPLTQRENATAFFRSFDNALDFQNTMMDAYATGSTVRLTQSYADQSGLESTSFTYDNAVSIHAYLLDRSRDSLARAEVLGQGLIYAQETNFPFNDGRFAQAYFVNQPSPSGAFITPAAFPFFFYTSAVGDQSWAGMALAQLYRRTRDSSYLTAALNVANWIVTNTFNTLGP